MSEEEKHLRRGQHSGRSAMPSFVRFCNMTNRIVDVIWLNYEGLGVRYRTLPPRHYIDVNTFVGHPWIFRDSVTGDKCVAQFKTVYEPRSSGEGPPRRKVVNITIPVYKLKDCCLQVLRKLVPRQSITRLEIPRVLQTELLSLPADYDISMADSQRPAQPSAATAQPQGSAEEPRLLNPRVPSRLAHLLVQPNAAGPQPSASNDAMNQTDSDQNSADSPQPSTSQQPDHTSDPQT